ncbi:hypothetical protein [Kinneretia aquatilis]|uniref:hypothetical protein n=1 Tax=Kinneretia aquatilis TaxID=2070761 RepID=UPI002557CC6E|nr:hypothetical protein [Paucibacter aquatile]WIV96287.1 hypothetical protein K9V56_014700 [Paucibacter aquatile]
MSLFISMQMANANELPPAELEAAVNTINEAQNRAMRASSSAQDVEQLFAQHYAPQFVYVHPAYGGSYSREQLRVNTLRNLRAGRYKDEQGRYQIRRIIPGSGAAAVERLELSSGQLHLSLFEFEGAKLVKLTEFWR